MTPTWCLTIAFSTSSTWAIGSKTARANSISTPATAASRSRSSAKTFPTSTQRYIRGRRAAADQRRLSCAVQVAPGFKVRHLIDEEKYPKLGVAGRGRQFVSPGSFHPTSGRMYEWDETFPDIGDGLRELPDSVLAAIARPLRKGKVPGCGKYTAKEMGRMLSGLNADDFNAYEPWLDIGMAAHFGTDGDAEAEWDEWSATGPTMAGRN